MKSDVYSLPVGSEDYLRLVALNNLCNPSTLAFLKNAKLSLTGKVIADIGCGIGMMSCELARLVGPTGKIISIDISHEQLELAKEHAKSNDITNIEFICQSIEELDQLSLNVDIVYSRFLLEHLLDQTAALRCMDDILKPSGYLFCENCTSYEVIFSVPELEAVKKWREAVLLQPKLHNTDFYIGKKLFTHFLKLGISPIKYQLQQPFLEAGQDRVNMLSALNNANMKQQYVDKRFYTQEEIENIGKNIIPIALQQDVLIGFVQYIQIIGQKK